MFQVHLFCHTHKVRESVLRPNSGLLAARVRTTQPLTERTSNPAVPFPSELEKEDPRFDRRGGQRLVRGKGAAGAAAVE